MPPWLSRLTGMAPWRCASARLQPGARCPALGPFSVTVSMLQGGVPHLSPTSRGASVSTACVYCEKGAQERGALWDSPCPGPRPSPVLPLSAPCPLSTHTTHTSTVLETALCFLPNNTTLALPLVFKYSSATYVFIVNPNLLGRPPRG